MVSSVTSTSTQAAANTISGSRDKLATNYPTFLSLLTTQLKNQDPSKPMDSTEFTQQLTQMTGVEQQLLTNDLLNKLVSQGGDSVSNAVSLIGKMATVNTNSNMLQKGAATWSYELASNLSSAQIDIKDSKGAVIYSGALSDTGSGSHKFTWDGKTSAGQTLADGGPYTATITTKDAASVSGSVTPTIQALVTGVESLNGAVLLSLGTNKVPSSAVLGVAAAS
jgi:flagellar basal-body rod modification protein FlgD